MTREEAGETAREMSARDDMTAFIYREGDTFQAQTGRHWYDLTPRQQANCVAIVQPDGWEMATAWAGEVLGAER